MSDPQSENGKSHQIFYLSFSLSMPEQTAHAMASIQNTPTTSPFSDGEESDLRDEVKFFLIIMLICYTNLTTLDPKILSKLPA